MVAEDTSEFREQATHAVQLVASLRQNGQLAIPLTDRELYRQARRVDMDVAR